MDYTHIERKKPGSRTRTVKTVPMDPSLEALRTGAAAPTREQMGRRLDLPDAMREKMETAFGADLSAVRLYESETVGEAGAKAVTQGADIAFAPGMLDFTSFGGQALLGHELSHVVTQARGEVTGGGFLNDASLEARADREGALAAAGESVAMPMTSLSPVSAASAAGPMQAALDKKDKKTPASAQTPVPVPPAAKPKEDYSAPAAKMNSIEQTGERLKKGNIGNSSAVMSVGTASGSDAVVKMRVTPELEMAAADLINIAGKTMTEKHGGSWNLDAPSARVPLPEEIANMDEAIKSGKLRGMYEDEYAPNATPDEIAFTERKHAMVYPKVGGSKRYDMDYDSDRSKAEALIAAGKKPVIANPENATERNDFFRTMGHASLLDLVMGNYDRMVQAENFENWLEDQDSRQLHLIDNDSPGDYGLRKSTVGADKKSNWLNWLMGYAGGSGDAKESSENALKVIKRKNDTAHKYMGGETAVGIAQAAEALPEIRQRLLAQYQQRNGGQDLDDYQRDIVDRMQITHEAMTDKDMAPIYKELGPMGLSPRAREDPQITNRRRELLAERDRLRRLKDLRSRGAMNLSLDD